MTADADDFEASTVISLETVASACARFHPVFSGSRD